ncbi:MAG: ABC transporter substrate-binding protein [Rhizobiaceae bacterium MnEN-MB40S]|nr:MAG: ABC transporter substrate-binding protein [Rhizobiaceae bacterium MnEN-MB40S]
MTKKTELPGVFRQLKTSRRSVLRSSAYLGLGLAAPSIISRAAWAQDAKKITFISEESNPKAQAVYDKINADFEAETGISVTMEYPGFENIAQRVATLIASGTPAELVWYGAGSAMEVALQGQLADVSDLVADLGIPDNLRLVVDGADRSVATSQQFVYGWYRSDLYDEAGLDPYSDWDSYLAVSEKLNNPPAMYGNIVPSAQSGASHLLMETMMQKNDAHWFKMGDDGEYEVYLDQGDNMGKVVETLEFLNNAHKFAPEGSNYSWGDLMSQYFTGRVANSYYVGARLLEQTLSNAPDLAPLTKPISLPAKETDNYYLSVQGFHVGKGSNEDGAKQYVKFFMNHPAYIEWLHSVPLHIIPAKQEVLNSEAYMDNDVIQQRMDVLEFLDSIWGKGRAPYYWDGDKLNKYVGLYQNDSLGGWMLAAMNIGGQDAESVVKEAADKIREKMSDL